jgi:hypothetical protein
LYYDVCGRCNILILKRAVCGRCNGSKAKVGNLIRGESVYTSTASDFKILLEFLSGISNKWENIGVALEVDQAFLSGQRKEPTDDQIRLYYVLKKWISNDVDVTWDKIIEVIEGPIVQEQATANRIKLYINN